MISQGNSWIGFNEDLDDKISILMSTFYSLQKPCRTETERLINLALAINSKTHLFSNITSPPSSATNESKATVVLVRTDPDCAFPIVEFLETTGPESRIRGSTNAQVSLQFIQYAPQ